MTTGDLFGLLALSSEADTETVAQAATRLAARFDPRRNPHPLAALEHRRILEARTRLTDPAERTAYLANPAAASPFTLTPLLSRRHIPAADEPQVVYALVDIGLTAIDTGHPPVPVNMSVVIDRSTSMLGPRLDQAKAGLVDVLNALRAKDVISVIAFSDRAETVVSAHAGSPEHKRLAQTKIAGVRAGGGTEIMRGLMRGLLEMHAHNTPGTLSHLLLLTDGETYGDEAECLLLAALAAQDGITITGLGIGSEWNDRFLDELTASTGGNAQLARTPEQVREFLLNHLAGLNLTVAERLRLDILPDAGVTVEQAFRFAPDPTPLPLDGRGAHLGDLPQGTPIRVLLKFRLEAAVPGPVAIARLSVSGDVACLGRRGARGLIDLELTAVAGRPATEPPGPLVEALSRLAQYRLQDQAAQASDRGDYGEASRAMTTLGTRLLAAGQTELARVAIAEAKRIEATKMMSAEAKKLLKYGTRALLMPADDPGHRSDNGQTAVSALRPPASAAGWRP
jgi:Ca-activated chloride channel family protein